MFWRNSYLISFELLSTEEADTSKLQISVPYQIKAFMGVKIVDIYQPVTDIVLYDNTARHFTSVITKLSAGKPNLSMTFLKVVKGKVKLSLFS